MKKVLYVFSMLAMSAMIFAQQGVVYAATVTNVTTSIANPIVSQPYSARIKFFYDGSVGPNVIVSNLPPGINLANPSAGYTDSIYALNQRDDSGYYYFDLTGTPTQTSSYAVPYAVGVYLFDTTHTFDIHQNYLLLTNT